MSFTHSEITVEEQEPRVRTNTKKIWKVVSSLLVGSSATFFPNSLPAGVTESFEIEKDIWLCFVGQRCEKAGRAESASPSRLKAGSPEEQG